MTVIPNSGRGKGGDSLTVGGVDREGNDARTTSRSCASTPGTPTSG
jgi:hypothetical protein